MQIQRLGHSMFRIISDEGKVIVVDPWIKGNPSCAKRWQEIERWIDTDLVLCTHAHFDHAMDLETMLDINDHVQGIVHFEHFMQAFAGRKQNVIPLNYGGSASLGNIKITMVPANHTSSFGEGDGYRNAGLGSGYVIRLENGFTLYISGDTGFMTEMKTLIGDVYTPDVAILSIGGVFCMGFAEAAYAASLIGAPLAIPSEWFPKIEDAPDPKGLQGMIDVFPLVTQMLERGNDFALEMQRYPGVAPLVLNLGDSFSPPKGYRPRSINREYP
jgi:L-ascorbate metabolism protein UlaG (beta-lactamase superfamily)